MEMRRGDAVSNEDGTADNTQHNVRLLGLYLKKVKVYKTVHDIYYMYYMMVILLQL